MIFNSTYTSLNHSARTLDIKFIILHYTEMPFHDAAKRLCDPIFNVSAHYIIKADGEIFQLVQDENIAWHAGESFWQGQTKLNQNSIGIEIDNLGTHEFSRIQMISVINLCKFLQKKYHILPENILGHSDIAPSRKIDPGKFFDWPALCNDNLGIEFKSLELIKHNKIIYHFRQEHHDIKIFQNKLKMIGYNIQVNGIFDLQTNYVVRAFQLHFAPRIFKNSSNEYLRDDNTQFYWDEYSQNIIDQI